MASVFVRSGLRAVRLAAAPTRVAGSVRALAGVPKPEDGSIPGIEGLAGRARKEAMYKQAYGEELFNRDATAYFEEGTKENPIPILSVEDSRIVGISLPDDPEIRWFTLHKGHLAYDPDTQNYLALKKVTPAEVEEWIAKAEKQVLSGLQKH